MSDTNKELLKTINAIAETLKNLERAAESMAQASITSVVYPNDALQTLFSEFKSLCDADTEAFNDMTKARDELGEQFGDLSYGDLRIKLGDEEAAIQYEGVTKAHERRKETFKANTAFRKKHPLVAALYDSTFRTFK